MLKRALSSAITAYLVMFGLFFGALYSSHVIDRHDIRRTCETTQAQWDTFQRVIEAAVNPPSRAGTKLSDEQVAALAAYRKALIQSVGDRPTC